MPLLLTRLATKTTSYASQKASKAELEGECLYSLSCREGSFSETQNRCLQDAYSDDHNGFYEKAHSVKGQRGGLREATRDQAKPLRAPFLFALRLSQSKVAWCSMGSIQAKALPFEPRPPMESGHTPLFAVALGL